MPKIIAALGLLCLCPTIALQVSHTATKPRGSSKLNADMATDVPDMEMTSLGNPEESSNGAFGLEAYAGRGPWGNREKTYELDVTKMAGVTDPVRFFDPAGFCSGADDETIRWYRAAELKHCRVAMLAFTGWVVNSAGIFWPADYDYAGDKFSNLGKSPLAAWDQLGDRGRLQIVLAIFFLEMSDEIRAKGVEHYVRGGPMGFQLDPFGIMEKYNSEERLRQQNKELNNGRLAMIGMIGFFSAANLDMSVPALSIFEVGDRVMGPIGFGKWFSILP